MEFTDDVDIKIEYVPPKCEPIHVLPSIRADIVTESEFRSTGILFETDIEFDYDSKHFISQTYGPSSENGEFARNDEYSGDALHVKARKCYECYVCGSKCKGIIDLRSHMSRHLHDRTHEDQSKDQSTNACPICSRKLSSKSSYRRHLLTHSKVDPTCPICNIQVRRGYTLKRHMRVHVTEKAYKCNLCPRAFSAEFNLKKHQQQHVIGNKYQCYLCSFSHRKLRELRFHFALEHTGKRIFKCKMCGAKYLQKDQLRSHESKHRDDAVSCEYCEKTFSCYKYLKPHMLRHTSSYKCEICSKVFASKADLKKHLRGVHLGEKPHECKICSKMFSEKANLKRHLVNVHSVGTPPEKNYHCTVCTYATYSQKILNRHALWHTNERRYSCNQCPNTFKTSGCLAKHVKGVHNALPKVYTCNICSATFNDRSSRLKHKSVHADRPYQCSFCSLQTTTDFLLKKHMQIHTRPFQCNICLRKFSTRGNLMRHEKRHGLHSASKRYECYICGHFARRGFETLKIHFSKHTGTKMFECNICSMAFKRPDNLRIHLRIHTGEKVN